MTWGEATSCDVVGQWIRAIQTDRDIFFDRIDIVSGMAAELKLRTDGTAFRVKTDAGSYSPAAAIKCFGFQPERDVPHSPQFLTLPFWMSDTLEHDFCGVEGGNDRVLIGGASDGAVQDVGCGRCFSRSRHSK